MMASIKMLQTRTFWITVMLLNKDFIHLSILIETLPVSRNTEHLQNSQRESQRESSICESNRSIASKSILCKCPGGESLSNADLTIIPLNCSSNKNIQKREQDLTNITDQGENDFVQYSKTKDDRYVTPSVMNKTVNKLEDTSIITLDGIEKTVNSSIILPSITITSNDLEDGSSTNALVINVTVGLNDLEDASSVTMSVINITVDDLADGSSVIPPVINVTITDLDDGSSVIPPVINVTVTDLDDGGSVIPPVINVTVDDFADSSSVIPPVINITVDDFADGSSVIPPVINVTVDSLNITMNYTPPPATLITIRLIVLYHMVWCIQVKLVENPPLWPYDSQYVNCQSPILFSESEVMRFTPGLDWVHNHTDLQVSVTMSFLGDLVWCSQHGFHGQFMFFSFENMLKLCQRTEEVAESFTFDGITSEKPRIEMMLSIIMTSLTFYHMIWCIQNESLSLKGLPISYQEFKSCKSPVFPFNNESIQGTNAAWWATPAALTYPMAFWVSTVIDILKCAQEKVFGDADLYHPDKVFKACEATDHIEITNTLEVQKDLRKWTKFKKQLSTMRPVYICLGIFALILGSLGNFLTFIIGVRRTMRQTSTGIYVSFLAIIDIVFLYIRIIPQLSDFIGGRNTNLPAIDFHCKTNLFFTFYVDHLSACIRLCFSVERMIAITLPYFYRTHSTQRCTVIILITCSIILGGFNSYSLFLVKADGKVCRYFTPIYNIFKWVDVILSTILPFIGIVLSNSIMLYILWRTNQQRQHMTDNTSSMHKIAVMCISSSLFFVLSTAPSRIYLLTNNLGMYYGLTNANVKLDVFLWLEMCRFANATISFLVYIISGSMFRQELRKLFNREIINRPTVNIAIE